MHRWMLMMLAGSVLLLTCAAGCESVVTTEPFGEPVRDADELRERLAGSWVVGDEVLHLRIEDNGELHGAALATTDDGFTMHEWRAVIHDHDDQWYLFLTTDEVDDDTDDKHFDFLRVSFASPDTMLFMLPDVRTFREAVEADRLAGEIQERQFDPDQVDEHGEAVDEAIGTDGQTSGRSVRRRAVQRTIVLTDRPSLESFINSEEVGRQFHVDTPIVLRRLTPARQR